MRELAELASLPVVTSMGGKGAIDETHPLAVGLIGRYSRKVANDIAGEADLMVVVGSRLGGMVTDTWSCRHPARGSSTSTPIPPCWAPRTARRWAWLATPS